MRVLLEEARRLACNLAYHRRARLETNIGHTLDEVDPQIQDLRRDKGECSGQRKAGAPAKLRPRPPFTGPMCPKRPR
jgi:hypothetical protein